MEDNSQSKAGQELASKLIDAFREVVPSGKYGVGEVISALTNTCVLLVVSAEVIDKNTFLLYVDKTWDNYAEELTDSESGEQLTH